jgi:aryl-alcohol dehydrogenase-like predicted oxidoreductase
MDRSTSRRNFLAAGLALPAAASASRSSAAAEPQQQQPSRPSSGSGLQYRVLGKTGLKVTTVGYGCMITSDPTVITRAADMGINYFDSSRNYSGGQNERMVGAALGARRKDVFVATKCDRRTGADILAELDTSLKELGTDHVDVWHLHGKSSPADIPDDMVEAQLKAKQQGKIRFTGVSTHNLPAIVDRLLEVKTEVVQVYYNFTAQYNSTPAYQQAFEKLNAAGVGLIAMKVMAAAGGGRGRGGQQPQAPARPASSFAAALKWAINKPFIHCTVPSMTDNEQLEQNFAVMAQKFTDEDQKLLRASMEQISPYFCRMCGACDGQCAQGLPVHDLVRFTMYADGYGQFPLGRENFKKMALEHQDVRCGDCSECTVKCPNGVRVAQQVARAQELFS